jgi:hypothetical protein
MGRKMGAKLVDALDPALDVSGMKENDVLGHVMVAIEPRMLEALAVSRWKRRLGGVSTPELAADKKLARRAAHSLFGVYQVVEPAVSWEEAVDLIEDEHRQVAAVLKWPTWLAQVSDICAVESRLVATWVLKMNLTSTLGRTLFVRLANACERLRVLA